jgi:ribosomal protein L11 methylase PrmA
MAVIASQDAVQQAVKQSARAADVQAPLQLTMADMFDEAWEASVRASYIPIQLTDNLWIVPDWCAAAAEHAMLRVRPLSSPDLGPSSW